MEWATYENIEKMYSLVYKELINSGIANELEEPAYFDKQNNIVGEDAAYFGTRSKCQVTDPSYLIFVDETGSSTNMRKDKVGSKNVITEKDFQEQGQKYQQTYDTQQWDLLRQLANLLCVALFFLVTPNEEFQVTG
jgi:hypothetical protein